MTCQGGTGICLRVSARSARYQALPDNTDPEARPLFLSWRQLGDTAD
jgi:hypothetical protein